MKLSNEFKVGVIAVLSIAFLILGFNFLKGNDLFEHNLRLIANYGNINGLQPSNPVMINGMQVGSVYKLTNDKDMRNIRVELIISKDISIPTNSIASIKPNPLGTSSIEINLGDAAAHLKSGDSIHTIPSGGLFDIVAKKIDPLLVDVKKTVGSLDSVLNNFNSIIDPSAKNNIGVSLDNLKKITASMTITSASLQALLNERTSSLAKSLNNVSSITDNLASSNGKINSVVSNLDKAAVKFSNLDLQKTLDSINLTIASMNNLVNNLGTGNGTVSKLLNDPTLYKNLASTGNKLNLLLDDIRTNPKRYINISLIGGKNKGKPLALPTPDTLNSPYYIEKVNARIP